MSEAEANAIESSHEPTSVLDLEKKSCYESPTQVSAIAQVENVDDQRDYIVGWRLYLLTFRLTSIEAGQDLTHEADSL